MDRAVMPSVNVGSGLEVLPNFVNLDNSPYLLAARLGPLFSAFMGAEKRALVRSAGLALDTGAVIRHDCRKRLPFADASVGHVLCSHFLEHVYPDEMARILLEFRRVLAPGGTVHIVVPDLKLAVDLYMADCASEAADRLIQWLLLSTPSRPSFRFRIMECLGYEGLKHRWMYDKASMTQRIQAAGFVVKEGVSTPSDSYRSDCKESLHVVGIR